MSDQFYSLDSGTNMKDLIVQPCKSTFHNFVQAPPRQIAACPRPVKSHNNFQAQDLLTGHKFGQLLGSHNAREAALGQN